MSMKEAAVKLIFTAGVWFTAQVGVIGVGVQTGSAAMQWAGFIGLGLVVAVLIIAQHEKLKQDRIPKDVDDHRHVIELPDEWKSDARSAILDPHAVGVQLVTPRGIVVVGELTRPRFVNGECRFAVEPGEAVFTREKITGEVGHTTDAT